MSNQKSKIIDLTEICNKPKQTIHNGLLWKFEGTPYSKPPVQQFDANSHEISYILREYTVQGELINKDYNNIRKIQLIHDKKSYCGLHFVFPLMGVQEVAVFEVHPALRKTVAHVMAEEDKDIPVIQIVEHKYKNIVDTNVLWIVEVVGAEEMIDYQKLSFEKRMLYLGKLKPNATVLYKEKKYQEAIEVYKKIRLFFDQIPKVLRASLTEEEKTTIKIELSRSYSNQAVCYFFMNEWSKSIELAQKAIQEWDENYKAYYYRARSHFERGQQSEAKEMFEEILVKFVNEDTSEVKQFLKLCQHQQIQYNEQNFYKKMIQNLSKVDKDEEAREQQEKFEKLQQNRKIDQLLKKANEGYTINKNDIQKI